MTTHRRILLRQRLRRWLFAASALALPVVAIAPSSRVSAADWFVSNSADSGAGSLRQAMLDASSGDRILFDAVLTGGDTILLASELPTISQNLTIDSTANEEAEVHGLQLFRVFFVESGNVEIKGLTITQGIAKGGDGAGSELGGTGGGGGGLGAGGAIFVDSGATVTLDQVTIQESVAEGGKGGTFDTASALGGGGGGGGLGGDGGTGSGGIVSGSDSKGGGGGGGGLIGAGGDSIFYGGGGGGGLDGQGGVGDGPPTLRDGLGTNSGGGGSFATNGGTGTGTAGAGGNGVTNGAGGGGGGGDGGLDGVDGTALNGGDGGNGGFGGGGGGTAADSASGIAGSGGEFGGGGGAGEGAFLAGDGGFGGGGGGASGVAGAFGGDGGFGGGGGAGDNAGLGGEFAGDAGTTGGGGGGALGGAIFVHQGGTLILKDTVISDSTLTAGVGAGNGASGESFGESIFLNASDLNLDASSEVTVTLTEAIGDSFLTTGTASNLNKTGAGTVILEGTNTYNGLTTVDDGRLVINGSIEEDVLVNPGAVLGGDGLIGGGIFSSGTLAAGNSIGTISTLGDLVVTGGSVEVEIDGGGNTPGVDNDLYDVGGTANLSGGIVEVVGTAANYTDGTQYTFLTAGTGITGAFTGISDNLFFFDATLDSTTSPGSLIAQIDANGNSLIAVSQTPNQSAISEYLEFVNAAPTGDFLDVMNALIASGPSATRQGLDEIAGQIYPTMAAAQLQTTSHNLSMLRDALSAKIPCKQDDILVGWVRGYTMGGNADRSGSGASGFDLDASGTEIAFQNCVSSGAAIGAFVNLSSADVELDSVNQSAKIDTRMFGGSLQLFGSTFYGLAIGGVGLQDYEVHRSFNFINPARSTKTDFDGTQAFVYLEQGMRIQTDSGLLQPFVGLQGIHLNQERFLEEGPDSFSLDLRGNSVNADSLRGLLGVSFLGQLGQSEKWRFDLRAAWMHEYLDSSQDFSSHSYWQELFYEQTTSVEIEGSDLGSDWAVLGAGLQCRLNDRLSLIGAYRTQFSSVQSFHAGSGGVQIQW
ncbi:MAG: autotransporter domain-containing protein [Rubripirellula sp.]